MISFLTFLLKVDSADINIAGTNLFHYINSGDKATWESVQKEECVVLHSLMLCPKLFHVSHENVYIYKIQIQI